MNATSVAPGLTGSEKPSAKSREGGFMKYGNFTLGQIEAIINKLGGKEGALRLLRGELFISNPTSAPKLIHDQTKSGWKLLEHTPRRITSVADIELVPFLREGEEWVEGEEMVRRARIEFDANLGQEDAEYILEHTAEIPAEFKDFYLVFPGTVWQDSDGYRHVSYLDSDGGRWYPDFLWIGDDWNSDGRLVRLRR